MKTNIILFILCFLATAVFSQTTENTVVLETKNGNIAGTLLSPIFSKKVPIVLIISGSGPTDRDGNNPLMKNNSLKMLAEGLLKEDIATLRYDKRGIGKSQNAGLEEHKLNFENYVEDAKSWIDFLAKDKRFSEIIILGHSEGSLIGMLAAQKKEVTKFISLAGISTPAGEIIRKQLEAQPQFILEQSLPILDTLEAGKMVENVPPMLHSLFRPSVQPYLISWFRYNPKVELGKLHIPILIVQGTTDIQVDVSNATTLAGANKRSQKRIIEQMNHILKESSMDRMSNLKTYNSPNLPLKEELLPILVKFIE